MRPTRPGRSTGGWRERLASPGGQALLGLVVSIAFALLLVGPALAPGVLLVRDFVTVPDPVLNDAALGRDGQAARAVPLNAVTAILAPVISAGVQQKVILFASIILAGSGAAWLVRRTPWAAPVAAALASWNPFLVERLLLGQAPTLLAYSTVPWIVAAVRSGGSLRRRLALTTAAVLPAALTPWGGVAATLTVIVTALTLSRRPRDLILALVPILLCLPWVIPSLLGAPTTAAAAGAGAFAAGTDSPFGGFVSVATLGGIWAEGVHLASRAQGRGVSISLAVLAIAAWGAWCGRDRRAVRLAGAAWALPVILVTLLATPLGIAVLSALQSVPGVGLIRDTHRLIGWSALGVAVLAARGLSDIGGRLPDLIGRRLVGALPVLGMSLAILTTPDASGALRAAYTPATYPAEWSKAVAAVPDRAHTLVLPWRPIRSTPWASGAPFLDPTGLALSGRTARASTLVVGRGDQTYRVADAEPASAIEWANGRVSRAGLDQEGVDAVMIWRDTPGPIPREIPGFDLVHDGEHWQVWIRPARSAPQR
ncbi:hypothetical protein [Janibacter sp. GXQ6167]|uniref:hypothetical protein n=1 Tax=Janibacter sp. GXQ6167 TaxID=3240791 RepID=UPI003525B4CC